MASPSTSEPSPSPAGPRDLIVPAARPGQPAQDPLLERILSRYDTRCLTLPVGGKEFTILAVRDSNILLERITPESFALEERLPYWADLWGSSLEMARWCLEDAGLRGLRVLELGCGVGLAGIAASAAGAHVTMTDYEEDALLFARYNVSVNAGALEHLPSLRRLDWRFPPEDVRYDALLGADIVYERTGFRQLLALFDRMLEPGGRVLLTEPGRSIGGDFVTLARGEGYAARVTEAERPDGRGTVTFRRILLRRGPDG